MRILPGPANYALYDLADGWARRNVEFGIAHDVLFAQASGYEFLGENAILKGEFQAGLGYAQLEFEIANKLHSRERHVWVHFIAAMGSFHTGDFERAEREFTEGIALAESIGELRGGSLLKGNFAILQADKAKSYVTESIGDRVEHQGLLDRALRLALENFEFGERLGLLYSRAEAHRCLAYVRFRRGELDEAERLCAATSEFLSKTESRVSQLWLGPLYIDVLLATSQRAKEAGDLDVAEAKRHLAIAHLARYQALVAKCQSPRFTDEAARLTNLVEHAENEIR